MRQLEFAQFQEFVEFQFDFLVLLQSVILVYFRLRNYSRCVGFFTHKPIYKCANTQHHIPFKLLYHHHFSERLLIQIERQIQDKTKFSQLRVLQPLTFILLASLFDQHETHPVGNMHSWYFSSSDVFMFSVLINRTFINLSACLTTEGNNCSAQQP